MTEWRAHDVERIRRLARASSVPPLIIVEGWRGYGVSTVVGDLCSVQGGEGGVLEVARPRERLLPRISAAWTGDAGAGVAGLATGLGFGESRPAWLVIDRAHLLSAAELAALVELHLRLDGHGPVLVLGGLPGVLARILGFRLNPDAVRVHRLALVSAEATAAWLDERRVALPSRELASTIVEHSGGSVRGLSMAAKMLTREPSLGLLEVGRRLEEMLFAAPYLARSAGEQAYLRGVAAGQTDVGAHPLWLTDRAHSRVRRELLDAGLIATPERGAVVLAIAGWGEWIAQRSGQPL